jgi:flagellar hook-associated protein 2
MAEVSGTSGSSYDYSMIGSVGSDAAQSVNGDMINKIRAAEEKASLDPIIEDIDNISLEEEKLEEIKAKVTEFVEIVEYFDLYNDENVFNQFLFDTSGTSAVFDAVDMSTLKEGTTSINVTQLAQRDVFQSNVTLEADIENNVSAGTLSIQIGTAAAIDFDTTDKTLAQIASEIDATDGLISSVEEVGDGEYRLIIKSDDSGTENELTITGAASQTLGYTTDGTTENAANHILTAQNLQATIDGVEYDVSSNSITTQGSLKITAVELGTSTITVSKDTSAITVAAEAMATKYNELVEMLNEEIYDSESVIGDKDTLRTILSDVKDMLFEDYGADTPTYGTEVDEYGDTVLAHSNVTNNDKNIFIFGFELDKSGNLTVDTDTMNDILNGEDDNYDFDDLKNVFTGVYENKGLGVQLKEYLDDLDGYEGLLSEYEENMDERLIDLEEDKEDEIERLDAKYGIMAEQFSAYSALIAQMEASFSGLKMMIEQSTASS